MHPPGADIVLIRHGEIGTKSEQVRRKMEGRLRDNIGAILADRGFDDPVERQRTRLFVHTDPGRIEGVTAAVTDAFGVVSASPARQVDPTLDAIGDALAETARTQYDGGTFAVRARRAGQPDAHPFSSKDIEEEGGAAVWQAAEATGVDPVVDLDDPDLTLYVECRPDQAFVFLEKRDGPGGLPVGTQRPLVALVSGGIDSPVAAWDAMRRGAPVYPLYVDLGDYGGVDHRLRAETTVATLQDHAPNLDLSLRVAPGGDGIDLLARESDQFRMLHFRRFMLRIAARVADETDAVGIVTGESIGQKSSQTTANLRATSAVTDYPVHRPLLTDDKSTITEQAREIGTFEDSTISAGCDRLAPANPATAARLSAVREAEPDGIATLATEAAERLSVIEPENGQ